MSDPIFSVRREDGWRLPDMRATGVRQAAVGGGVLLVSTSDGRIVRWTGAGLSADDDTGAIPGPELVEVERRGSEFRVHNLFVDPSGYHALISAVLAGVGFTYYLGGTSSNAAAASRSGGGAAKLQAREVPALRTVIESVAWNAARGADDSRVGPLLVGTSNGRVLEVRIENKRDASAERVWELPDTYAQPLSCLRLEQFAQASADKPSRYFAMAVTAGPPLRCFYFNGGPTLGGMFASSGTTAASSAAGATPGGGGGPGGTPAGAKQALLFTEVRTEPKLSALQGSGAAAAGASARGYPAGSAASGGVSSTASSAAAAGGPSVAPGGGFPLGSRSDAGSARGGSFTSQASAAGGVPATLPVAAHLGSPDLQLYVTSPGAATAPGGPAASGSGSSSGSAGGPSARGGPGSLQQLRAGTALRPDVFALLSSAGLLVGRLNLTAAAAGASALATSSGSLAGGSTGTVDPAAAAVTANNAVVSGLQLISYPPVSSGSTGTGGASGAGGSGGVGSLGSPGGASGGFGSVRGSEYGAQGQQLQQPHAAAASSGSSSAGAVAGGAGQRHIVTNPADFPLSVAITDYHFLLLFRHRLVAVSRVSQEVVQELPLPEERCGAMRGMCVDGALAADLTPRSFSSGVLGGAAGASAGVSGIGSGIWLFSDRGVFSLRITGEDRDVWRLLLRRGDFDAALTILDAAAAASATLGSNPFGAPSGASGGGFGGGFGGMPSLASLLDGPGGLAAAAAPLGLSGAELARRREQVRAAQAEYLMGRGAYDAAARAWREAPSAAPFEEVCLKFIHAGAHAALQAYVGYKLASLTPVEEGGTLVATSASAGGSGGGSGTGGSGSGGRALKVQRTVLCTWLTEMYLSRLHTLAGAAAAKPGAPYSSSGGASSSAGASAAGGIAPATGLAAFGGGPSSTAAAAASGGSGSGGTATASAAYEALITDFKRFLTTYRSSLDKATTLALLASHGRSDELLFFCTLCRDYDRVVAHHLQRRDYKAALEALRRVPVLSPSFEELWYSHSPLLMQHLPRATADAWREAAERAGGVGGGSGGADAGGGGGGGGGLDPVRLIPAMVRYEQTRHAALNAIAAGAASRSAGPVGLPAALGGSTSTAAASAAAAAGGAVGSLPFSIETSADFAGGMDVALAFCEWIVARGGRGSRDRALHNFLLSLYAQQPLEELCCAYIDGQTEGMDAVPSGTHRYAAGGSAALSPLALPPASGFGGAGSTGGVRAGGFETYHSLQDAAADGATGGSGGNPFGGDGGGDGSDGTTGSSGRRGPAFDLQFAVRVCLSERKYRACAKLFTAMGLHAEAVETALTVAAHTLAEARRSSAAAAAAAASTAASAAARGVRGGLAVGGHARDATNDANDEIDLHGLTRLARAAANAIPDVERELPLRKKVWLRIAAWLVAHGGGAQEVLGVLQDSGGALKVDDVLPVFPSASIINEFKAGVASSLAETQHAISGLKEEMRGYQDAADRIRNDIRSLRGRCAYVRGGQRCEMCAAPLLSAPFYVFPCSHAFHRDCLLAEVLRHLTASQRRNVEALVLDVARVSAAVDMHTTGASGPSAAAAGGGGSGGGAAGRAAGGRGGVLLDARGGRRGSGGAGGLLAGMKGIGGGSSGIASLLGGAGSGGGRDGSNVTAALAARLTTILPKSATAALGTSGAAGAALMHVAAASASASTGELVAALLRKREALQAALDKGIAGECLFCGDIMIYSVAEPLSLNSVGAVRHLGGGALGAGGGGTVDEDDDWDV